MIAGAGTLGFDQLVNLAIANPNLLPFIQTGVDLVDWPWWPLVLTAPDQMNLGDAAVLQLKKYFTNSMGYVFLGGPRHSEVRIACYGFQQLDSDRGVILAYLQAHSTNNRRVHPGHIGIRQKAFDSRGFEASLRKKRLSQVTELADCDEFRSFATVHRTIIRLGASTI
jgi:hypothetical protein